MIHRVTTSLLVRVSTLLAALLIGLWATAPSYAQDDAAKQFLNGIYKQYLGKNAPGADYTSEKLASRYFDDTLTKLIVRDQKESEGEIGRIGFDPFINGQDFEIRSVNVTVTAEDADRARGVVGFTNFGRRQKVTYDLIRTAKGWRISDIHWEGTKDTFRSLLSQPL